MTVRLRWLIPLLALACVKPKSEPEAVVTLKREGDKVIVPESSPLRERIKVAAARSEQISHTLSAPAVVEADPSRLTRISPPLPGRVVKLLVKFGDTVKRGQTLLTLDAPDAVSAQADLLKARSALSQADRTLTRQRDLQTHGIGARREVEQAQTDRDVAAGELARTELRLKLLNVAANRLGQPIEVKSPIDGKVVDLSVSQGEFHNDANAVLMTVADLSTVWVTANVQERDIGRIGVVGDDGEGATAVFAAYPGETFHGKVSSISSLLDPSTRALKARLSLGNADGRLKPGMFATVTFVSRAVASIVVPTAALVQIGDSTYVFQEIAPWTFVRRVVEMTDQQRGLAVIGTGLAVGDRIATVNAVLLQ